MSDAILEGGCQCRAVRYEVRGAPLLAAICHCTMCRRAHAAPAVAWAMFGEAQLRYTRGAPKRYASSAEAQRGFCADCGTPLSFSADFLPGLVDIAIGSLDRPDAIVPSLHYWHGERLAWAEFADALPRYPELPPMA
jgi:hypothetical protein